MKKVLLITSLIFYLIFTLFLLLYQNAKEIIYNRVPHPQIYFGVPATGMFALLIVEVFTLDEKDQKNNEKVTLLGLSMTHLSCKVILWLCTFITIIGGIYILR